MKKIIQIISISCIALLLSCNAQKRMSGNYSYETECMGVELDGSQTVKAWGSGRNREDAIEQAKKNGVRDVLMRGISYGKNECNVKPVLFEVNVQEKNETYFNKFFADNGEYKSFITGEDGSDLHSSVSKGKKKAGDQVIYGVIIRVQRAKLKEKMIQDNIIK